MKKIPTLFARNFDGDHLLRGEVLPECEWVLKGEGVATRKYDGTAILIRDGKAYRRFDAKNGKTPPPDFVPCEPGPDPVTTHWPGWIPALREQPENRWLYEALDNSDPDLPDWTYELCGPKINGNPEGIVGRHLLFKHGQNRIDTPRTFAGFTGYLATANIEGIVFWRDINDVDCDKAKVKTRDFGLVRSSLVAASQQQPMMRGRYQRVAPDRRNRRCV